MPTRSLQTRIVALFLALIVVVQLGGFVLVNSVGVSTARKSIGEDLVAGSRVFDRVLEQERIRLLQAARLLSADQAFRPGRCLARQIVGQRGAGPVWPPGRRRVADADSGDDVVAADTLDVGAGESFFFPRLLAQRARRRTGIGDGRRARPALPARDRTGDGAVAL